VDLIYDAESGALKAIDSTGDVPFAGAGGSVTPAALVTAAEAANANQREDTRVALRAEDSHHPYHRLARWRDRLSPVKGVGGISPVIAFNGDSMINQAVDQLQNAIIPRLGVAGFAFVPAACEGGSVSLNDPTLWFCSKLQTGSSTSGLGARLSGSGHMASINTGAADNGAGDTIKVYYITQPSGGVFKVQTKENGGAWTDEVGYTAVNSSGTLGGSVITITKATFRKTYSVRCVWVSGGNVDVVGFGIYIANHRGVRFAQLHAGGGAGTLSDWVTQIPAISNPIFADIGIDLLLLSHLDDEPSVATHQAQWQELVSRASAVNIAGIVSNSSSFTVTTSAAHNFAVGDMVKMKGSNVGLYNSQWFTVSSVPTATTFTCGSALNPGAASASGSVAREPTWMVIGPPIGEDAGEETDRIAQADAMEELAAARQDAYWDNRRWAESTAAAISNQFISVGDVHYSIIARRNWVTKMILDTGLLDSPDRWSFSEGISFNKGGSLRRYRATNMGLPAPTDTEHAGVFRICNPDGVSSVAKLEVEDASVPGNTNTAQFRRNNGIGLLGLTGSDLWAYDSGGGTGSFWYHFGSTAGTPLGNIGADSVPIRSLYLAKTIIAAGTTATPQTINKVSGSVNFAAGATSVVVNNSLVRTPSANGNTGSIIMATVRTNDATMKSAAAVCSANGSFTLHADAAPTAETRVDFLIIAP
jgi:hypothetical protein